jgi:hypothetical protein
MVRRRKPIDDLAAAAAHPPQAVPAGAIKADFAAMMPGYRKRHDGWNQQRLQRFLDVLAHTGCVEDACRCAGMSDVAPYRAKKKYPLFAAAWDDALERSRQGLIAIAYKRAVEGRETIIIRKGEEYERRIQPSDVMLSLLLKRGDMAGGGTGLDPAEMVTIDEWRRHIRFDERGRKVEIEDPAQSAAKFSAKMAQIRARLNAHAAAGGACPCCKQQLPEGWPNQSMAELLAAGVVSEEELWPD